MFEGFLAVPLHFTIEFLGFLVFAGAAVLVLSRPETLGGGGVGRYTTASGLVVLAAANVLHGANLEPAMHDGDMVPVALRTAGFLLVAGGLAAPSQRAMAAAIGPLQLREPLVLVPAAAAVLMSISALRRARGGGPPLRAVAAAAALLAASEGLTAIEPTGDFSSGVVGVYAYGGHAAKLLGYLALATWLSRSARASIRTRFVAVFSALLLGLVLVLSTALIGVISDNVGDQQLRTVRSQLAAATEAIDADREDLFAETGQIANLPEVRRTASEGGNAAALVDGIRTGLEFFDVDFVALLDAGGRRLAHSHERPRLIVPGKGVQPRTLGEVDVVALLGSPVVTELLAGRRGSSSLDTIPRSGIVMELAGASISTPSGRGRAGYLVTARWVDQLTIEGISDSYAPSRATLVVGDEVVASTLSGRATARSVVPPEVRRELLLGGRETLQQSIAGGAYFGSVGPLPDALGNPTAAMLSLSAPSAVVADTRTDVIRVLFLVALGIAFVVLVLAWVSGRRITRPIRQLTRTAAAVREGDLDATAPISGEDEVGRLGSTFNEMTSALRRTTADLRTAAREQRELRERIEKIIQSMADGLVAVDQERKIVAFNAEAEVMTGRDAADVLGKPVTEVLEIIDPQGGAVHLPIFDLVGGTIGGVFLRRPRRDPVPVAVTSAALQDERGGTAGGVAVLRDMTREREIDRMKSEFLQNISHELRTPLTPIKGYADMLSRKGVPAEKQRRFASGILDSTVQLERIIGLLVDFAALEAGKLAPRAKPIDMGDLLVRLRKEWAERAAGHEIVTEIDPHLRKVIGDERLLRRSLEEIIDNAVKFSPEGGIIRLSARNETVNGATGHRIELAVTDEGIGIESENLARVFSDFQQLDGSETRTYGGLGLGLSFVRRIMEAHEGTVEIESEPERGTRMILRIPSVNAEPTARGD